MDKRKKILFVSAIVFTLIFIIILDFTPLGILGLRKENGGHGLFDTMLLYSADEVYDILAVTSGPGLHLYIRCHTYDYFFMAGLFAVQFLFLQYLISRNKLHRLQPLYIFPVGQLFFDIIENILLDVTVRALPQRIDTVVKLASIATVAKWYFVLGYIVTVVLIIGICRKKKKPALANGVTGGVAEVKTDNQIESGGEE